jgi:hypothetical protein
MEEFASVSLADCGSFSLIRYLNDRHGGRPNQAEIDDRRGRYQTKQSANGGDEAGIPLVRASVVSSSPHWENAARVIETENQNVICRAEHARDAETVVPPRSGYLA